MLRNLPALFILATAVRGLVGISHQQLFFFIDDCEQYNTTAALTASASDSEAATATAEFGAPLCGSDGLTYANGRLLRCVNARKPRHERVRPRHSGRCVDDHRLGISAGGAAGEDGGNVRSSEVSGVGIDSRGGGGGGSSGGGSSGGGSSGGDHDDAAAAAEGRGPRCPYHPLYEPVCASDNVTYANADALACRASLLNVDLKVRHRGACLCPEPCVRAQERSGSQEVVCASNGLTYANVDQVLCLKKYQKELDVLHDGACSESEARRAAASRHLACALAKSRHEWRPLCGHDNVTYPNLFVMHCFRPDVRVSYAGRCGDEEALRCAAVEESVLVRTEAPTSSSARTSSGRTARNEDVLPLCGSNGETYASADHLTCAARINKHLFARHLGACEAEDDPCATRPLLAGTGAPVCGSDGHSYVTAAALWCAARTTSPGLKYVHDGPCLHARVRGCVWS